MGNTQLRHSGTNVKDRFEKADMKIIRSEMTLKQFTLEAKQEELIAKLAKEFDNETFRQLNVVNHNIEVAESRLHGDWMYGNYPKYATTATSR